MKLKTFFLATNVSNFESETVDGIATLGFYQLNSTVNCFGNMLETVFCTCFDNAELLNPAPALLEGFGYSNAHAPVELRMVVEVPSASIMSRSARLFDF